MRLRLICSAYIILLLPSPSRELHSSICIFRAFVKLEFKDISMELTMNSSNKKFEYMKNNSIIFFFFYINMCIKNLDDSSVKYMNQSDLLPKLTKPDRSEWVYCKGEKTRQYCTNDPTICGLLRFMLCIQSTHWNLDNLEQSISWMEIFWKTWFFGE